MANNIPEGCEKYFVLNIINPGEYWMAKSQSSIDLTTKIQQFRYLLSKNVEKISSPNAISVGKICAVKIKEEFHRALVKDIFNKNSKIVYLVLLIDCGSVIEVNEKMLYWIKNEDLIHKKSIGIKVCIHDIQPVAVELECEKYFLDGIFCKRVQDNWSLSAYKYVQQLFSKNLPVYVKTVEIKDLSILGKIYFLEEPDNVPVSLSQKLCDDGFAIFIDFNLKNPIKTSFIGGIEKKIPDTAFFPNSPSRSLDIFSRYESESTTESQSNSTSTGRNSWWKKKSFVKSDCSAMDRTEIKQSDSNPSLDTSSNTYSSSWLIKKHVPLMLSPPSDFS